MVGLKPSRVPAAELKTLSCFIEGALVFVGGVGAFQCVHECSVTHSVQLKPGAALRFGPPQTCVSCHCPPLPADPSLLVTLSSMTSSLGVNEDIKRETCRQEATWEVEVLSPTSQSVY